jgi:hypothetical protein
MPVIAILIMLSFVSLFGVFMAIFSERWVDWITRFWEEKTKSETNDAKELSQSTYVRSRKTEIWIYRISGIFFAVVALVMLILVLLAAW